MSDRKVYRNVQTGEYVSEEEALAHPDVTVGETVHEDDQPEEGDQP